MHKPVVIVGGGPAGLAAAIELGSRCIVFEQGRLPHDKTCGGMLTPIVQRWLVERGFKKENFAATYRDVNLYFDDEQVALHYDYPIIAALPRVALSRFLLEKASEAGAEILTGSEVKSVNVDAQQIRVGRETVPYAALIVASGHGNPVDKPLFDYGYTCDTPLFTLQYRLHHVPFDRLATGWSMSFGPNYTWAMGLGSHGVHVGIVGPNGHWVLKRGLKVWFERLGLPMPEREPDYDFVPFVPSRVALGRDVCVIGDTAGLAAPMTGEGILSAIMSGQWAARRILNPGYAGEELALIHSRQRLQRFLFGTRRNVAWLRRTNRIIRRLADYKLGRQALAWLFGMSPMTAHHKEVIHRPG